MGTWDKTDKNSQPSGSRVRGMGVTFIVLAIKSRDLRWWGEGTASKREKSERRSCSRNTRVPTRVEGTFALRRKSKREGWWEWGGGGWQLWVFTLKLCLRIGTVGVRGGGGGHESG